MVFRGKEKRFDIYQDLTIMIIMVVVCYVLAVVFDLFDRMAQWLKNVEDYEVAEIFMMIPVVLAMVSWYQARRVRVMKSLMDQAKINEKELTDRVGALEKELKETGRDLRKEMALNYQVSRYEALLQPTVPNLKNHSQE